MPTPNRYANLTPNKNINQDFGIITEGFGKVQDDIDNHVGHGGDVHPEAVAGGDAGFMSGADKDKLNNIESGAEVNQNAFATVNDIAAGDPMGTLTLEGGTGITVTTVPEDKKIRIVATGESTPGIHGIEHNHDGTDPIPELDEVREDLATHLLDVATTETLGHVRVDGVTITVDEDGIISSLGGGDAFNVKHYGATGDGETDDTEAIQAALDAAESAGGGVVWVPIGVYMLSEVLEVPDNVAFEGAGWSAILRSSENLGTMLINKNQVDPENIVIRNLQFDGNNMGSAPSSRQHGVEVYRVKGFIIEHCKVINCTGYGIWACETYPGGTDYSVYGTIRSNYCENNQVNIETTNSRYISIVENDIVMTDGRTLSGIHPFDGSEFIHIAGNKITGSSAGCGIDIANASNITIAPNVIAVANGTASPSDRSECIVIQSSSSKITITGGIYYSKDSMAINVMSGSDITVTGANLNGYVTTVYHGNNASDVNISGNRIVTRGPASGAILTVALFYESNNARCSATNNNVSMSGQSGYLQPVRFGAGSSVKLRDNVCNEAMYDDNYSVRGTKSITVTSGQRAATDTITYSGFTFTGFTVTPVLIGSVQNGNGIGDSERPASISFRDITATGCTIIVDFHANASSNRTVSVGWQAINP